MFKLIRILREEEIQRRELKKPTKLRVINATVMPIPYYMHVRPRQWSDIAKSKVQAFEMRCLRKVEGVTILDNMRFEEVRSRLGSGGSTIQSGEGADRMDEEDM